MKINKQLTLNGQIKDRGGIKWTAMMLPEHVQMLRDWQKEDPFNKKPDLDAFDLEAIYEEIHLAVVRQCAIEIRLWRSQSQVFTGTIAAVDLNAKFLFLDIGLQSERISFAEIIGAKTIE